MYLIIFKLNTLCVCLLNLNKRDQLEFAKFNLNISFVIFLSVVDSFLPKSRLIVLKIKKVYFFYTCNELIMNEQRIY